jgi:pimeloyl-ACP methyl ester carboxylesterase
MDSINATDIYLKDLGFSTRVIDEGRGPVVLLLHGNPDNADEWNNLIRLLQKDFRCIAPDLPGYGRTGKTFELPASYDYTAKSQAAFVDSVLAHLNIKDPVIIVVHDIGGMMGVPWAAQNIAKVRAMIYTNTVVFPYKWFTAALRWGNESFTGKLAAHLSMSVIGLNKGSLFRKIFARQHPQLNKTELDRFVNDFALNPVAKSTSLREFRKITKTEFYDGFDRMRKAIADTVPTTIIWGQGDPYIADSFASQIGASKITFLPNIGHWVPILAAEAIAKEIRLCRDGQIKS